MKFFTKFVDVICFVIGPALLLASIFGFSYSYLLSAYFYSIETLNSIAIATALIAIGVLRMYWAKKS